jgi:nanoRNase/pAp phosphatase (c-di-AMP/oligoRNAs hydrolase)
MFFHALYIDLMNLSKSNPLDQNRLEKLKVTAGTGPVLILTHDNPDPDALASGIALGTLLKSAWNIPSRMVYSGLVQRSENRVLLNLLTPEWEHSDVLTELDQYSAIALVDTQPGAGNNRLPITHLPDIVIDHHQPLRETVGTIPYADIQPKIGATVTILDQYMEIAGIVPDPDLATAMFYALKTDTRGLSRGASPTDKEVYLKLLAQADHIKLIQVEQAGLSQRHFRGISHALQIARVYDRSVVAYLGSVHRPDLAAEIADILIRLEEAQAVLCLGLHKQTLYFSIRTEPMGWEAGLLIQRIIVPPGKAGGHGTMAGGQLPIGEHEVGPLANEIIRRFLKVMKEKGEGRPLC